MQYKSIDDFFASAGLPNILDKLQEALLSERLDPRSLSGQMLYSICYNFQVEHTNQRRFPPLVRDFAAALYASHGSRVSEFMKGCCHHGIGQAGAHATATALINLPWPDTAGSRALIKVASPDASWVAGISRPHIQAMLR